MLCQHLEDLHNPMNQYFQNNQFMIQNCVWVRVIQSARQTNGFDVTEYESSFTHGDLTSLAPHERLPEILVVPREKTPTGAAARGNP